MGEIDKLGRLKKDVISNMSKGKFKKYLFYLTRKYYEAYLEDDEESFNECIENLMDVISEYRETYINLMGYVYYTLYLNAILIISEKSSNEDFSLKNIQKYDLFEEDDEEELHHDIKNIFNKERVRRRYYEKGIEESLE